jgi:hypothetical protein
MRLPLLIAALALAACSPGEGRPAGNPETRTYPITDFKTLAVSTGIRVILKQGPYAIEATSENGDLSRLKVEQHDFELSLSSDSILTMGRSPTYTVTVAAPEWNALDASSGSSVTGETLKLTDFKLDASSGAQVKLTGECTTLEANAAAGAQVDASELKCAAATADALAGGNISVFASDTATASATAGGKIDVYGHPASFTETKVAGGNVTSH